MSYTSAYQSDYLSEALFRDMATDRARKKFVDLVAEAETCKACVSLDWLSINFWDLTSQVPAPAEINEVRTITPTITLKDTGIPTKLFKTNWQVLYKGEFLANLLCYPNNPKIMRKGFTTIDFKNALLYTDSLWPFHDEVKEAFQLTYKNVKRADIAIDGANHVMQFLNLYVKQEGGEQVIAQNGKSKFKSDVLDKNTMLYHNFRLGKSDSRKMLTVYNKSQEILRSGKEYIQDKWISSSIVREAMPFALLSKTFKDKEILYVPQYENVYRVEMRVKGEMFLKMKDFTIDWLKSGDMLVSIFKRMADNFFEFVWKTRAELCKCDKVPLLPYHLFNISSIELQEAKPMKNLFKTKMAVHKNVSQLYEGSLVADDAAVYQMLCFDVVKFSLQKWFIRKVDEWDKEYSHTAQSADDLQAARAVISAIDDEFRVQLAQQGEDATPTEAEDDNDYLDFDEGFEEEGGY